ncbi:MAG: electron transfer flavoprotein subunit alpha/FixB family protein [Deltaproteobacteria bacterium]|nr:electron transfer flavoprotein subunit alpha/FixB family protein [Deltaproteobacteria bacterium]
MDGECWVLCERREATVRRVSLEVIGKLRSLDCNPVAVLPGTGLDAPASAVAPYVAKVLAVEHPLLADYDGATYAHVLADLVTERAPRLLVAGATSFGRDLGARLAARLGAGYVPDAVDLGVSAAGELVVTRPVLGARAYAVLAFRAAGPRLVTVRPNAFPPPDPLPAGPGAVERVTPVPDPALASVRVLQRLRTGAGSVDLSEADVVVTGGRGVRGPEGFAVVEQLAAALGAAVGASRAVVDAGWRDHAMQVGKSGRTVSPKLYVALGVSGAVHHRMGMDSANTIVVVNSDPKAPFFQHADYGIVGDLFQVAPLLAGEIRRLLRS